MSDMLDRFTILTEDLDHPEDLVWDPSSGRLYAGGEAGQIYAVSLSGDVEQVADTGGGILGLAVDAAGVVYACDEGRAEVLRIDPRDGRVEVYSAGTPQRPMIEPNYCVFDARRRSVRHGLLRLGGAERRDLPHRRPGERRSSGRTPCGATRTAAA